MSLLQTEKPNRRSLPNFYAGKQKQSVFFSFLFTHHAQKHARPESAPQGRRWIVRKSSSRLLLRTESRSPGQDEGFGGGGGRGGGGNAVQKLFLAFERLRNFFSFSWSFASSPERLVYARCQFTPSFNGNQTPGKVLPRTRRERERKRGRESGRASASKWKRRAEKVRKFCGDADRETPL